MTNKPRLSIHQSANKSLMNESPHIPRNGIHSQPDNTYNVAPAHTLAQAPNFRNMAGIQKLAIEPTREHIENIRQMLMRVNAKDNTDQQIALNKDHKTGIATLCIKSAAKNGISAKMMCDFLDAIDDLYNWPEGKGVIIYGHGGFFCSGKYVHKCEPSKLQ